MAPKAADPKHAAEIEARIVEAARDLLAEAGLEGLSMRAVASRLGVTAPAIYHYFESKQALVDRVVAEGCRRFEEAYLWRAVEAWPAGSAQRLKALGLAYIRFALENPQYFKVIFTIEPRDRRAIEELPGQGGYPILRRSVEEAMASAAIRRADPDLVALYLWSVVHGLVTLSLACTLEGCSPGLAEADPLELFERVSEFVLDGLRPRVA
jgi:AcrR family transcriptional regulator